MDKELYEIMTKMQNKAIRYKSQKRLKLTYNDDEYYSYILFEYIKNLQQQVKKKDEVIEKAINIIAKEFLCYDNESDEYIQGLKIIKILKEVE